MVDSVIILLCFAVSFIVSTLFIRLGIPAIKQCQQEDRTLKGETLTSDVDGARPPIPESKAKARVFDFGSTGLWIGLFETILIFVLVFEREYGALAIIVAAKEFVRKSKVEQDPTYYLLGTLSNLGVATLFALLARMLTG